MASRWILLLLGFRLVVSQTGITLPDPARCVAGSGVTAFPACQYMYSQFATCSAYAAASSAYEYFNCFCAQNYFDSLFDCNSEERLCLGNGQQIDQYLSNQVSIWHSECDPHLAYTPTTPVQSSITASYNTAACLSADASCKELTAARVSCTQGYQSGEESSLTSCLCQPALLTLAYGCSILGNVSCVQVPAHLTDMGEYGHCSNLQQVLTIPTSLTASLGANTTIRATYFTPSSTAEPTTPETAATTAGSAATTAESAATTAESTTPTTSSNKAGRTIPSAQQIVWWLATIEQIGEYLVGW